MHDMGKQVQLETVIWLVCVSNILFARGMDESRGHLSKRGRLIAAMPETSRRHNVSTAIKDAHTLLDQSTTYARVLKGHTAATLNNHESGPHFGRKASFSPLFDPLPAADRCRMGACWYIAPKPKHSSSAPVPVASAYTTVSVCGFSLASKPGSLE
jgi:hypothetical protein